MPADPRHVQMTEVLSRGMQCSLAGLQKLNHIETESVQQAAARTTPCRNWTSLQDMQIAVAVGRYSERALQQITAPQCKENKGAGPAAAAAAALTFVNRLVFFSRNGTKLMCSSFGWTVCGRKKTQSVKLSK